MRVLMINLNTRLIRLSWAGSRFADSRGPDGNEDAAYRHEFLTDLLVER